MVIKSVVFINKNCGFLRIFATTIGNNNYEKK